MSGAAQALSASAAMIANKPAAEVGFSFKAISLEKRTGTAGVPAQWLVRTYAANPVCAIDPVARITIRLHCSQIEESVGHGSIMRHAVAAHRRPQARISMPRPAVSFDRRQSALFRQRMADGISIRNHFARNSPAFHGIMSSEPTPARPERARGKEHGRQSGGTGHRIRFQGHNLQPGSTANVGRFRKPFCVGNAASRPGGVETRFMRTCPDSDRWLRTRPRSARTVQETAARRR